MAIRDYASAIKLAQNDVDSYINRGNFYCEHDKQALAIKDSRSFNAKVCYAVFKSGNDANSSVCNTDLWKSSELIGENGGYLVNAKFFLERPYCTGVKSYKFSTANYLRLFI